MYYVMRASAPSLHRESTDSLIKGTAKCVQIILSRANNYLVKVQQKVQVK